ncbi:amidohydrolase [Solimonas sp. K1W22B-7]|uniref:amidohydrolase family protein n=1 Tax=Solimonas sp. K1W22B-7 TaxID=2303331 RepID=UPI000E332F44|nr:amidohydrolase family protein [Solimonas sp. K1W22B-7]AXQ27933.1 amidohydrolase [Solimonas sp. K1W22B-7]
MNEENQEPASLKRRNVLKGALQMGAASVGAFALSGCGESSAAEVPPVDDGSGVTPPGGNYRVDVHCHHIPDFYRVSLAAHGIVTAGGIPIPPWTPQLAVNFMNKYGIQTQIVSISEPGVAYLPTPAERMAMAQQINDYTRETLIDAGSPGLAGRFGGFAVIPLGDPDNPLDILNACAEAVRAINVLGMDGIGLLTNYKGIYLGDPRLTPLMLTLNTLGAMVFVHPVTPVKPDSIVLPTFLFEFTFDTTRAAVNMLYNGVYRLYSRIRWLLAHAGGALPFLSYRTSLLTLTPAIADNLGIPAIEDIEVFGSYRDLYYDTALSPAAAAMKSVREVTTLDHILFATDWPFSNLAFLATTTGDPQPRLSDTFNAGERLKVERDNALAQFPRLAAMSGR